MVKLNSLFISIVYPSLLAAALPADLIQQRSSNSSDNVNKYVPSMDYVPHKV
jgi:hypothetical protein